MSRQLIKKTVQDELELNIPDHLAEMVKAVTEPFIFSDDIVCKIQSVFEQEMNYGLMANPPKRSSLQMANTFIPHLLTGKEKGTFLALDLGGTQFRVLVVSVGGELDDAASDDALMSCAIKHYEVPEEIRNGGEGRDLFEYITECIQIFVEEHDLMGQSYKLGFCFSFPMEQRSIDEGILITWTKSFTTRNVEGTEVVQQLRAALAQHPDLDIDVIAIVNDAPATLVGGSEYDQRTGIGLILGTGCNAAYFEKVDKILKWEGEHPGVEEVIIDIEWGAFGDTGELDFIKTQFDKNVDEKSLIPRSFTFEKLLAGKFIGPLTKEILQKLIDMEGLFQGSDVEAEEWQLDASEVSDIVDDLKSLDLIKSIFVGKGFHTASILDAEIARYVSKVVSIRGSLLVSICLASLLRRMDRPFVTVAVDGSLFKNHPKYEFYMEKFIKALAPDHKFRLKLTEDASGVGAGLLAAIISGIENKSVLHV